MSLRVVVIGAGVSGLCTAWWLKRAGATVTVLEKERWPGGTMRTVLEDGWLIETGPNSALETTPLFEEIFAGADILQDRVYASPAANKRYILRGGRLHPLPMSPRAFLGTPLWSTSGKLRLLKEPFIGRGVKDESIAEFVERRLGREFLDYAINPFVAGVYAGSPEQLSVRAAFPKLHALEEKYGGLIMGMIRGARERKRRAEKAKDRAKMFSFVRGMQAFPEAIAGQLGDSVKYGSTVHSIGKEQDGDKPPFVLEVSIEGRPGRIESDAVVLSVPAYTAAHLVRPFSSRLASELEAVNYPPVAEVFLGFPRNHVRRELDGFGFLVPAVETRNILGTIWSSSLFPNRAPEGYVALTTFVGGSRQPDVALYDDKDLQNVVLKDLRELMGVEGEPVFSRIIRWERAIPQYNLGYHRILEMIDQLEAAIPGLLLCSNYRGGIAVGDCVMSAKRTADAVLSGMREKKGSNVLKEATV
jgi:oxygen-dependent protoporphyrinogen oxidase